MAYPIIGQPKPQFLDSNGDPYASGTLEIQDPGTTNPKTYYPTADDADAGTNGATATITLDAAGKVPNQLWGRDKENYKYILKDSDGVTVDTVDDIRLPPHSRRAKVALPASDSTPSVADSNYFQLNADNTTISDFDDGESGDIISIQGPASGVTRITNSNIQLRHDADILMQSADQLTLLNDGSNWREISRTRFTPSEMKVKSADESLSSSTLANDTHLNGFVLAPGSFYKVTGYLEVDADAAARDLELNFDSDFALQRSSYSWISVDSGSALTVDEGETQELTTAVAAIDIDGTSAVGILIMGSVFTNASSICTVDVQFANAAGAGSVEVRRGSWVKFEQIA